MDSPTEVPPTIKITKNSRYHQLHAKERNEKNRQRYNSNPEVIRKREEREQRKAEKNAEKQAEKEAARAEKQRIKEEKLKLAIQTSQIKK